MILVGVLVVICLTLLLVGFVAPRFSHRPQNGLDRKLSEAYRKAAGHHGLLGTMGKGSARTSRKAVDKSTGAGRAARRKSE